MFSGGMILLLLIPVVRLGPEGFYSIKVNKPEFAADLTKTNLDSATDTQRSEYVTCIPIKLQNFTVVFKIFCEALVQDSSDKSLTLII
jgi:hypothetical protein